MTHDPDTIHIAPEKERYKKIIVGKGQLGPVFRTVQGPHRDGGENAKKTGWNTTGRDRQPSSGPGQGTQRTAGVGWDPRALHARPF